MNYFFTIQVKCVNDSYSASALGEQGEWARGLNIALENLLNKLLAKGIEKVINPVPYEPNEEIPSNAQGPSTVGSAPIGDNETPPSKKTHQKKLRA